MALAHNEGIAARQRNRLLGSIPRIGPLSAFLWVMLLLISVALIVYPIGVAIIVEWPNLTTGLADLVTGNLSRTLPAAIANTVIVVTGATGVALVIGAALAWANERTDASLGFIGQLLPLAALILPPIAGVIGWANLLDPRAGLLNLLLRGLLSQIGIVIQDGPFDIYSMLGLIFVTGLYTVPYVYLIVSAALQRLDPSLEEAARVSGAGPFRTTLKVTLPAIRPALAAALPLSFISGISLFSVPAVLGARAKIDVLSVYIYRLLSEYPAKTAPALILALGLLVTVQIMLLSQGLFLKRGRNATISGKGMRATPVRLGAIRHAVRGIAIVYLLMTAVLPILGLALVSLQPFWTPSINWSVLSLKNFQTVLFDNRQTIQALLNSMMLGCAVATCNMLLTGAIALHFNKSGSMRKLVDGLTGLPATIPHTVIGVAFILAFSHEPLRLYGTTTILFLAYIVMTITYAARSAAAAADSIGAELGEASRVSKATDIVTLWKIQLPLAMPGLVAGWIMVFVHTVGEVTASAFLSGPRNPVIGRVLLDFWTFGNFPQVAALALVISAISASLVGAMLFVTRRSRDATTR